MKAKSYYSAPEGYIKSPFIKELYHDPDVPITDECLQEVVQSVIDVEGEDLDRLTELIKLDCLAYIRKGCIYAEIKFNRLYKHLYTRFDDYAEEVLGTTTKSVCSYIHASRVGLILLFAGFSYSDLPQNMSQAYALHCALSGLYGDYSDQQLIDAWQQVLAEIPRHKRTGERIKELVNPTPVKKEDLYTKVELPLAVYTKVLQVAYNAKLSVSKLIDNVVSVLTGFKKQEIISFVKWVLDMNNLLGEM
ncbi:MAG: hypothetical protein QNJ60_01845 [Xenococcaceae cyanobacterium MO_188.B19]|nr:hypothetical protein [Xenococcaceae cyanobacterium MO_188.B19]